MSLNHSTSFHSHPNQSSKYIDPQKIYPKRLGTYQNGNALVLEYYNLATDKFKKHVIPLDHSKSAKENLDLIYKNPKHGVLLRKVEPKYVENVLKGESVIGPSIVTGQRQSFSQPSSQSHQKFSYSQKPSSQVSHLPSSQPQQFQYPSQYTSSLANKQNYNNQNSVSLIQSKPSNGLSQQAKQKIQQVEDYYEEQFEDFEVSQSMGKKNNISSGQGKKQAVVDLSVNSNPANQSVSMPLQSKYNHVEEDELKEEKKEKKSKKSKQGKKSKKKKQQPEEDQFDFDFLDGDGTEKKPSKPKQSSKKKTKTKEKSKQKDKTTKKQKVQEKPKPESKPVKETVVQDDFDFDL